MSFVRLTSTAARASASTFASSASTRLSTSVSSRSFSSSSTSSLRDHDIVILSTARTPIGAWLGSLSSLSGPQLGAIAISAALSRAKLKPEQVDEVILGNVVSSNVGQAPATQAAHRAGLPPTIPSTTINKVCSSGMKTVTLGAQSIATGHANVVVCGGFESMSNVPYYLPKVRSGLGLGDSQVIDGVVKDGLWDSFNNIHMGNCAELCAKDFGITRQQQDEYALESYRRAQEAQKNGWFNKEIAPVVVKGKKGEEVTVSIDEEPAKLLAAKVPTLKPAFQPKDGTVTAANSSKLNDGASSIIISSAKWARENGFTPIARIRGFGDAQRKPVEFTIAPADAIPRALKFAGLGLSDVDYFEINEAFSVVALANAKLLKLDSSRVNAWGGAVALGHPVGNSGSRIMVTLLSILEQKNKTIGVAGICNGGGGATAIVLERLN